MSFASNVKKELTDLEVHREHVEVELAALIQMNSSLSLVNQQFVLNVQTENAIIARRMYSLLKNHYHAQAKLLVRKKVKLKKNSVYIVRLKQDTQKILADLDIMDEVIFNGNVPNEIIGDAQKIRSYLRGVSMASGSVNNPGTSRYHLEIFSIYREHNNDICKMLNYYDLSARTLGRQNEYICYLKGIEKIADFLTLIDTTNSVLKFEDARIVRDIRNSVNRLMNCETANLNRTIDAALKQIGNIQFIESTVGLISLPEKLQEIAELQLECPEVSLRELGEMTPSGAISKSGINHRIRKINKFAEKLRGESA